MDIIKKTENKLVFKGEVEESLANAVRRYVHQISTIAIDEVEISKNDSPLYDETIAHRLGLIPLKYSAKKDGKLKLKTNKEGFVYSEELKGDFKVAYDKIPITLLNKGQEIELSATTKTGKGSEHSKFLPGLFSYRNTFEITLDKEIAEKVKQIIPEIDLRIKGTKALIIDDKEKEVCDICDGMVDKENKEIEIKPMKELIFYIESFGQVECKDIFTKSINFLRKDLEEVAKKISK